MKTISCSLPDSLAAALQQRMDADKETRDHIVARALSEYLATPLHTLFQVSTSAALVEGIYQGAVRVSRLLQHGDFGLGTFIDLDGEMVVLDGVCYRVSATGAVTPVEGDRLIPYAVVTQFSSSVRKNIQKVSNFDELVQVCDQLRDSNNVFYAFRIDGHFDVVKTRVMKPVPKGTGLRNGRVRSAGISIRRRAGNPGGNMVAGVRCLVQRSRLPLPFSIGGSAKRRPRSRLPGLGGRDRWLRDERNACLTARDGRLSESRFDA